MTKLEEARLGPRAIVTSLIAVATTACSDSEDRPVSKPASTPQEMYTLASMASGLAVGNATAANPVYVFFDPQCPDCATLWANVKPLLGQARLIWIPVGLLRPSSAPQGAAILAAKDQVAAMDEHEASILNRTGGISAFGAASADAKAKVADNTALFKDTGNRYVPLIVFKNQRTGSYGTRAGSLGTEAFADLIGL